MHNVTISFCRKSPAKVYSTLESRTFVARGKDWGAAGHASAPRLTLQDCDGEAMDGEQLGASERGVRQNEEKK